MTTFDLDLRSPGHRGGSATRVYDQHGFRVSLGDWTSVQDGAIRVELDGYVLGWTAERLRDREPDELRAVLYAAVLTRLSVQQFMALNGAMLAAYAEGHRHGEHDRAELIREALMVPRYSGCSHPDGDVP